MNKNAWEEWWLYFITNYIQLGEEWTCRVMAGEQLTRGAFWDEKRIEWAKEKGYWYKVKK